MEILKGKKAGIVGMVFSMVLLLSILGICRPAKAAPQIPEADVTYNSSNVWSGTLPVTKNKTIKLSGITLTDVNGSAISVGNGVTLNLVIEGTNVLSVLSTNNEACINVPLGATLNIYGVEGASLTVSGGKWGAGIGTKGTDNHTSNIPGTINIISGSITAYGGTGGGAGIGSGRGSSGGTVNITGGSVTAYGRGHGAGIGSGYCTSGGSIGSGYQSGSFTGGNITITGGTVKAASGEVNFSVINDEPSSYNQNETHGAGIGGGYGSSSGTIIIGGNAEVLAVGQCGGAGIGAGRGTSTDGNYDINCTPYNITICENAKLKAYAGADTRHNHSGTQLASGAAIGGGRGIGSTENSGSITIKDNVQVSANAGAVAQAIGNSVAAGVEIHTDTVFSNVAPKPATAKVETQCVEKIAAKVGGQAVQNVAMYFKEVVTATPAAVSASTPQSVPVASQPTWTRDSGNYTFTIQESGNITLEKLTNLYVDGKKLVLNTDYTARPGSIIITVMSSALRNLSNGQHTFEVEFGTEKVNVTFTVKSPSYNYNYDYDDNDDDDSSVPTTVTVTGEKKKAPKTGER